MLYVSKLSKQYVESKWAISEISFSTASGEIVALVGNNGAGKTTTLKCIAGILPFEKGNIEVNNLNIVENEIAYKQMIAYLPDVPSLYTFMTGREYLDFILNIYGIKRKERENSIQTYVKEFHVQEIIDNYISTYSHGTKQKISIISALMRTPQLMLLDEPFVGLDPGTICQVKKELRKFVGHGGCIVLSTHDLNIAFELSDNFVVMEKGRNIALLRKTDEFCNIKIKEMLEISKV